MGITLPQRIVVSALLKVEILKANHNPAVRGNAKAVVVSALLKVEILKANHNERALLLVADGLYLHYLK